MTFDRSGGAEFQSEPEKGIRDFSFETYSMGTYGYEYFLYGFT